MLACPDLAPKQAFDCCHSLSRRKGRWARACQTARGTEASDDRWGRTSRALTQRFGGGRASPRQWWDGAAGLTLTLSWGGSAALGQFMGSALRPTSERAAVRSLAVWPGGEVEAAGCCRVPRNRGRDGPSQAVPSRGCRGVLGLHLFLHVDVVPAVTPTGPRFWPRFGGDNKSINQSPASQNGIVVFCSLFSPCARQETMRGGEGWGGLSSPWGLRGTRNPLLLLPADDSSPDAGRGRSGAGLAAVRLQHRRHQRPAEGESRAVPAAKTNTPPSRLAHPP